MGDRLAEAPPPNEEKPVLAATAWRDNSAIIIDCKRLGYINVRSNTIDPTYGRGRWWARWRPIKLTRHDLILDGVDFRDLPHEDGEFDVATFDPPYVAYGGRNTTSMPDFLDRFGLKTAPTTTAALQAMNDEGLAEMRRVVRRGGMILTKCQDYVNGGKLYLGTHHTLTTGLKLGLELVDRLEHVAMSPRPQPSRTKNGEPGRQQHARRNLSTMFVFKRT